MALSEEEQQTMNDVKKSYETAHTEFENFFTELAINPDKSLTVQFKASIKGETLVRFMWMRKFWVQTGLISPDAFAGAIIKSGIREFSQECLRADEVTRNVRNEIVDRLPEALRAEVLSHVSKNFICQLKLAEEESLRGSLGESHG